MFGFVIPAGAQLPTPIFNLLCAWLSQSGIDPNQLDGTKPIYIGAGLITASTTSGALQGPIRAVCPDEIVYWFNEYGWGVEEIVHPNVMELADPPVVLELDDMATLIEQLRAGREKEREGKAEAEEARDQILARLRTESADIGTVGGRPAVQWKTVTKTQFQTVKFRNAHPELAAEFTGERTENRLELL